MNREALDFVSLQCPRCRLSQVENSLGLAHVAAASGDHVQEGLLECSEDSCRATYPIVAGVPVVQSDMVAWWTHARARIAKFPGSTPQMTEFFTSLQSRAVERWETLGLLGTYMDSHYGTGRESTYWREVTRILSNSPSGGLGVDIGCGVGRATFELARTCEYAVGVDHHFDLLAAAVRVQRDPQAAFARRRRGRRFETESVAYDAPSNCLFVLADGMQPPLQFDAFDRVTALNVLDNVPVPLTLMQQIEALLTRDGRLVLSSPYDWQPNITEPAEWLESEETDATSTIVALLSGNLMPELNWTFEDINVIKSVEWQLRQHDRHLRQFTVDLVHARKAVN